MQFSEKLLHTLDFSWSAGRIPTKLGITLKFIIREHRAKPTNNQFLCPCLIIQLPCVNYLLLPFFECMPNWVLFFGLAELFLVSSVTKSSAILTCMAHMHAVPYTAFFISPVWLQNLKLLTTVFHYVTTCNLSMI